MKTQRGSRTIGARESRPVGDRRGSMKVNAEVQGEGESEGRVR
jgi:hypothetical protein